MVEMLNASVGRKHALDRNVQAALTHIAALGEDETVKKQVAWSRFCEY